MASALAYCANGALSSSNCIPSCRTSLFKQHSAVPPTWATNLVASPVIPLQFETSLFVRAQSKVCLRKGLQSTRTFHGKLGYQNFKLGRPRRPVVCQAARNATLADDYYGLLGVSKSVDKAELKRAYRKLALVFHPDVNKEEGAQESFVALSNAYEVLIDDEQRKLFDKYGAEGLKRQQNKSSGSAWEVWDEFKPMNKKKSRKQSARDAAAEGASTSGRDGDEESDGAVFAQNGDVVEFPLSDAARDRINDGRDKGVGFVVGRNIDRGDKHKLSPENLTLCEVEVLWQEDGDERWTVDPMESSAFADLLELRVLRSEFDRLSDSWKILDELSPGCGSPSYAEEVIL